MASVNPHPQFSGPNTLIRAADTPQIGRDRPATGGLPYPEKDPGQAACRWRVGL